MRSAMAYRRSVLLFVLAAGLVGLAHGNGKQAPRFIQVLADVPGVVLRWRSTAPALAVIERSGDLVGWKPIRTNTVRADATNTVVDASAPGPAAHYRIHVNP